MMMNRSIRRLLLPSILRWFYSCCFFFRVFVCGEIVLKGNGTIISNKMVMFLFTFRVRIVFVFVLWFEFEFDGNFCDAAKFGRSRAIDVCTHFFFFKWMNWIELTLIEWVATWNKLKFQFFVFDVFLLDLRNILTNDYPPSADEIQYMAMHCKRWT